VTAVFIAVVAGVALIGISGLSFALPAVRRFFRRHYRGMDDRRLIEAGVAARMMRKRMQVSVWVAPIVLGLSLVLADKFVQDQRLTEGLLCVMILLIFSSISGRLVFARMEVFTVSELESRKDKSKAQGQGIEPGRV
jgi:hypothetical protein